MIALCCHWDDAEAFKKADIAKKKLLKQWTHTCKAFGIYHLIIIGDTAAIPRLGDNELEIEIFNNYQKVRNKYKTQYVIITEEGEDLKKFDHSGDCIYVVGSNYSNPSVMAGDKTIGIKTASITGGDKQFPLHDIIAAGIVLHDRYIKWHYQ